MRQIDETAILAAKDDEVLSDLLKSQKWFILGCAFRTSKRFITTSDDEWSIAIMAFSDAVHTYNFSKGSFLKYAETCIQWRLIDYHRIEQKHNPEESVDPYVFTVEPTEGKGAYHDQIRVVLKLATRQDLAVKDEIEAVNAEFQKFGFSFYDLAECSPKSHKTKTACRQAVRCILAYPAIRDELYDKKQLPQKKIQTYTGLPLKLLEHHRNYIIAAVEILSGEYPCLEEYVSFIRKEE